MEFPTAIILQLATPLIQVISLKSSDSQKGQKSSCYNQQDKEEE
jgi:hypothetical protein